MTIDPLVCKISTCLLNSTDNSVNQQGFLLTASALLLLKLGIFHLHPYLCLFHVALVKYLSEPEWQFWNLWYTKGVYITMGGASAWIVLLLLCCVAVDGAIDVSFSMIAFDAYISLSTPPNHRCLGCCVCALS